MAFVDRIPGRFIENFHGTSLELRFSTDLKVFTGRYKPDRVRSASSATEAMGAFDNSSLLGEFTKPEVLLRHTGMEKMCHLVGTVRHGHLSDHLDDGITLVGRWVRDDEDHQGAFEMRLNLTSAEGWWNDGDEDDDKRVPWSWNVDSKTTRFFRFIHSRRMVRFSVLSAWLFLFLTMIQLYYSVRSYTMSTT